MLMFDLAVTATYTLQGRRKKGGQGGQGGWGGKGGQGGWGARGAVTPNFFET